MKRTRPLIRKTPLQRYTALRRKPVQPTEDKELTGYYNRSIMVSSWICENCGEYIPHNQEWQLYAAQCHVLDKDKYPEVRGNFLNRLHLCVRCHSDWDCSWQKAKTMHVFKRALMLYCAFAHLLNKKPPAFH